jgi:hypothetical protein
MFNRVEDFLNELRELQKRYQLEIEFTDFGRGFLCDRSIARNRTVILGYIDDELNFEEV